MRVFAILNQKGGSGKTTTTINLGAALAELGRHVLVLDLDPQASATHWLGADEGDGIYQVVVERLPVGPFVTHTAIDRLDLVPASKKLALVEQDARRKAGRRISTPPRDCQTVGSVGFRPDGLPTGTWPAHD